MTSTRTRIAWTVGVLLLLVVAAALVLPRLLDEARVRAEVERRLADALGVPVTIRGPVHLHVGAELEIDVADVTVGGGAAGSAAVGAAADAVPPLATIERVRASVEAASLARGPLRIGDLRIDAPRLRLHVDESGRANWSALTSGGEESGDPARQWSLEGLRMERGELRYTDARSGADYAVADWSLRLGRVELPAPFELTTRFTARSGEQPLGTADLRARVVADPGAQRYGLEAATLTAQLARAAGPLPVGVEVAALAYAAETGTVTLNALTFTAAGVRGRIGGTARDLANAPVADLRLAVEPFEPRGVLRVLAIEPPPMAGPDALVRASVNGRVRYRDDRIELAELAAVLDDTRLAGRVAATTVAPRRWTLDLTADRIVVDRYLKPEALRDDSPVALPLEFLRGLDAGGQLRVGELVASGVRVRDVVIDLGATAERPRDAAAPDAAVHTDGKRAE